MSSITVQTKEELKRAYNNHYDEINVVGKLAKTVYQSRKIARKSKAAIAALTTAIAAVTIGTVIAPATGGTSAIVSYAVAVPMAASVGVEVSVILLCASVGVAMIVALFKDYDVEFSADPLRLRLTKK